MHINAHDELKDRRQRAIADLIREHVLGSQDEVAVRLAGLGFDVTQATVLARSRAAWSAQGPTRRAGQLCIAGPAGRGRRRSVPAGHRPSRLGSIDRGAATIVVLKTPPGTAHLVGVALDESALPEIAGTICGDDTIFAACRSSADADALTAKAQGNVELNCHLSV
jgi:transcriptional regulator of arginine metabolism